MRNLRTIVGVKLCHAQSLSQLIISHVGRTPTIPKFLVPKLFFPVPGTLGPVLNMVIGQDSRSRYTFEKHALNQAACQLEFCEGSLGRLLKKS